MDIADPYELIAKEAGLTVGQVGTYLAQVLPQSDGSWLVYFGVEADRDPEVSGKLPASKTIRISKEKVQGYEHGNG